MTVNDRTALVPCPSRRDPHEARTFFTFNQQQPFATLSERDVGNPADAAHTLLEMLRSEYGLDYRPDSVRSVFLSRSRTVIGVTPYHFVCCAVNTTHLENSEGLFLELSYPQLRGDRIQRISPRRRQVLACGELLRFLREEAEADQQRASLREQARQLIIAA